MKNDHDSCAPGASAEGASPFQLEPSKAARKRCKGVTRNGMACTAWAMQGGLCYFHANPNSFIVDLPNLRLFLAITTAKASNRCLSQVTVPLRPLRMVK